MTKNITNILLIALVVLNLVLLYVLFAKEKEPHSSIRNHQQRVDRVFREELKFDETQLKLVRENRKEHFRKIRESHQRSREYKKELIEALTSDPVDRDLVDSLRAEIIQVTAAEHDDLIEHIEKLNTMCKGEQRKKLRKIFMKKKKRLLRHE